MAQRAGNPFTPVFGHLPYTVAGRTDCLDDIVGGLADSPGDPNRATLLIGPRGSGKTVLLATIAQTAAAQGWVCASVTADADLPVLLLHQLRKNAGHLLEADGTFDVTSLQVGPLGVGRTRRPAETNWRIELDELVEQLSARGVGVLFAVDEVDPACQELVSLVSDYQRFVTAGRDVALMLAGLPGVATGLMHDKRVSFIRRAVQRTLGPIAQAEVEEALLTTIEDNGRRITPAALQQAAEATGGYAYAIQLIGFYLWRCGSPDEPLTEEHVAAALPLARRELENAVVVPTLHELTPREAQYLAAMAVDDDVSSTGEVARRMGISMTNASNIRRRLLAQHAIREVRMGQVAFELPLLRDYLRTHPQ